MSEHFRYFDDWRNAELECPNCGWRGKFSEGSVEYYEALIDCSCPKCPWDKVSTLAIVPLPSIEELKLYGNAADKESVGRSEQFQREFEAAKLKRPEDLPDLSNEQIVVDWDCVEGKDFRLTTVLRADGRALFTELCLWEGYGRFREVCEILRLKYGTRLKDVVPTPESQLYLFGDCLSASEVVQRARRAVSGR